jgi:hypothetical protein
MADEAEDKLPDLPILPGETEEESPVVPAQNLPDLQDIPVDKGKSDSVDSWKPFDEAPYRAAPSPELPADNKVPLQPKIDETDWKPNRSDLREDGSMKGPGFLGVRKGRGKMEGKSMSEYSVGVEIDGKEMDVPSMVPTLSNDELDDVLHGNITDSIQRKASDHAKQRISEGKSVLAEIDIPDLPDPVEPKPFVPELAEDAKMPKIGGPLPLPKSSKDYKPTKQEEYNFQQQSRRKQYEERQEERRGTYEERKSMGLPGAGPDPMPNSVPLPSLPSLPGGQSGTASGIDLAKTNELLEKMVELLTQIKDAKGGFR